MRFHVRADTARPSRVCWARVQRSRALNRRPGNCGRLDEDFIHSVRSQLPIRGKYLDHHGSVEALAFWAGNGSVQDFTGSRPSANI